MGQQNQKNQNKNRQGNNQNKVRPQIKITEEVVSTPTPAQESNIEVLSEIKSTIEESLNNKEYKFDTELDQSDTIDAVWKEEHTNADPLDAVNKILNGFTPEVDHPTPDVGDNISNIVASSNVDDVEISEVDEDESIEINTDDSSFKTNDESYGDKFGEACMILSEDETHLFDNGVLVETGEAKKLTEAKDSERPRLDKGTGLFTTTPVEAYSYGSHYECARIEGKFRVAAVLNGSPLVIEKVTKRLKQLNECFVLDGRNIYLRTFETKDAATRERKRMAALGVKTILVE